jgi:PAS domain S-box-containing protein
MSTREAVNILLVDDQPAKLLSYEVILGELGENLIKANSANEALTTLLTTDVAVLLVDVCMPDLDGFELVDMIRNHPRFENIAIIFVSAIQLTDIDRIRAYASGAVDYVSVPVVAEILRAKVRVFADLYRKTKQLELLAIELEQRVRSRTNELEVSTRKLKESDDRLRQALLAGNMGTWQRNLAANNCFRDSSLNALLGLEPVESTQPINNYLNYVHPDDRQTVTAAWRDAIENCETYEAEFRISRSDGMIRWLREQGRVSTSPDGMSNYLTGLTLDITDRKRAEERQDLLIQELNHRVKNMLAMVQSIAVQSLSGSRRQERDLFLSRIHALAACQDLLTKNHWDGAHLRDVFQNTFAPHCNSAARIQMQGDDKIISARDAISISLALHELVTNAVKYGALANDAGRIIIDWTIKAEETGPKLYFEWREVDGPEVFEPTRQGFGSRLLKSLAAQTGAAYTGAFRPSGFNCELTLPLEAAL